MPPVPRAAERQDIYAACVQAAVDSGKSVAHRMLTGAEKSLLKRAAATLDEDARRCQIEAAQLLSRHQATLRAAYPAALRLEFSNSEVADSPKPIVLSFESLELMAEDQVDETVELMRAQQTVLSAVESELTPLNALISAAQGDKIVRASANPLRPQAWVRALRDATLQCPVPAAVRLRWMNHLSEALGPELAAVYRQLSHLLRKQGIAAAAFVVVTTPSASDGAAGAQRTASESAQAPSAVQPLLNLRDLRRLLIGERATPPESQGDARPTLDTAAESIDPGLTVPWSFQALQEMKQVDQVLQRMKQRRAAGGMAGLAVAREGGPAAVTPAQALSQEVVKLTVENIAADQRLLPKVQQAVRDLEPALLRLVQNDPRFFNDKQHPGRQFLFEMTQRSLAWSSADAPGFAVFFEPLRQAVDALAALPIENAEPFEFALHSLKQAWGEQEERNRHQRARAARILIKAEKRNLVAERIAGDIRSRPDMSTAPGEIRRFLTGPWSQVMAAAQLADTSGAADPGGYAAIINDLIWTTQPRLAAQNPARLAMLVPPLLQTVRHGLASIEYPADATQRLLDYLTGQHQTALRARTDAAAMPEPQSRDELDSQGAKQQAEPEVWLEQTEARESGLMERISDAALDWRVTLGPDYAHTQPISAQSPADLPAAGLLPGVWADVFINGAWSRWQLAWASPHALLFMFTDGSGKYQSMTRTLLDKMVGLGALRVMSQTVLEGALDAVAQKALRNSTDSAT